MVMYIKSRGIYLRVDDDFLERFTNVAKSMGLSRSEAIRMAMEMFIASNNKETMTSKIRGLVKTSLLLKDLEEGYMVSKL